MSETNTSIIKEMNKSEIVALVIPKDQITEEQLQQLMEIYKAGYGERWISEDHFRSTVMKNTSQVVQLLQGVNLAAALNINIRRITDIAVNPDFQGQGLGVRLFEEAARVDPNIWISVSADAAAMLATVTDQRLNYFPVEDRDKIEKMFRELNGIGENFRINLESMKHPLLSKRMKRKGIDQDRFVAITRPNSLHGSTYKQIVFQNHP